MTSENALTCGRWVRHGLIKIWQPDSSPSPTLVSRRVRRLLDERYDRNEWWTRPPLADDPQVCRRRLTALIAEVDASDERSKEVA